MLNKDFFLKIIDTVKTNYSSDAKDLSEALDLVSLALDGLYDNSTNKINDLMAKRKMSEAKDLMDFPEIVLNIQGQIDEYSSLLSEEDEQDEIINEATTDEETEKRDLPNYEEYQVDAAIPHSIDEDFTHTKACGFSINGNYYDANNMRDVLIQTCGIFADTDLNKMESFLKDPTMKGRKVSYFGTKQVVEDFTVKNEAIPGTDIFVWVNLSCNHIRNIIRKMLKKYGYKRDDFKIYLRADYSDLHKPKAKPQTNNQPPVGEDKIGKLVNKTMRMISDNSYNFSENELIAMQSAQWSKDTFGVYEVLIKKYNPELGITTQVTVNGYPRFWKEIFIFNGEKYFVTSQWYERHRKAFTKWAKRFNMEEK